MKIGHDGAGAGDEFGPDSFWHHLGAWATEWWKETGISADVPCEAEDYAALVDEFLDEEDDEADWWKNQDSN
jgi:hypothetical protein